MRYSTILFAALLLGCGSEAEVEVTPEPVAQPAVVEAPGQPPPRSRHNGTVVMAGRHPVEVVPHRSGEVYAYMPEGAPPPSDVNLTVTVPVRGRASGRPVPMQWNPRRERYEGRVRRLEIVEGPVDVVLVVAGVEYVGHVDVIVIAPAIAVVVVDHHGKHKHKHKRGKHGRVIRIY